ncbi:Short-chain dehydrogenase/reductase family protein [Mycena venus]|uniref:Short-chain dehydrogenase/reductase family protein n=1 Tax=Mycena venus TaxID=2733690 RepID=A0A8H7CST2_9AGAR|nr:Short-chain dehydrogenase/reductase family protein [Mycena venus]
MVRTIFVTGGNQGLGMHTVHQLGTTPEVIVFMASRKIAAAKEALAKFAAEINGSSEVVPVQLDITDAASIEAAHAFVMEFLRKKGLSSLDVWINNAAIIGKTFEDTYATNVFGTVAVTEAFRPLLSKGGSIINISSGLGSLGLTNKDTPLHAPYASSKTVLNMLTVQWSLEEEKKGSGIRVISICPGWNATNKRVRWTDGALGRVQSHSEGCFGEGREDSHLYSQGWGIPVVTTPWNRQVRPEPI